MSMKVVELQAENVKRLKAVRIKPDGSVVEITGKNGQGKSSVIDAIWYAMGGKSAAPDAVIRDDEESARAFVDLGELTIERTWTEGGESKLVVKGKDGVGLRTPQTVIDKLIDRMCFDPLAFLRQKPDEQVAALRKMTGLDFTADNAEYKRLYDLRTAVNVEVKNVKARLDQMPPVNAPDEETPVATLLEEHTKAIKAKQANDEARKEPASLKTRRSEFVVNLGKWNAELERLQTNIKAATESVANIDKAIASAEAAAAALVDPDIDAIAARMKGLDDANKLVRAKRARAAEKEKLADAEARSRELTAKLEAIEDGKRQKLAAVKMPVPGLGFADDVGVTLNDKPLAVASQAEQIRLAVAVALAAHPEFRVAFVKDGSLLDSNSRKLLAEIVSEHDAQLWIERATDGEPVGIVIEDGEVKGDHRQVTPHSPAVPPTSQPEQLIEV